MNNFDIANFYKKIYSQIDDKYYAISRKSNPCGTKNNKYLAEYYLPHAYLRMYFTKEETLDVCVTVGKYGPSERNMYLEFTKKELNDEKTVELIVCIIKLISYSMLCPEYYGFESDYLHYVLYYNKNTKHKFPLEKEKMEEISSKYYCRYYQVLLWEIQNIKDDPDMWISFVNGKYFLLFEQIANTTKGCLCDNIENSNIPKYLKKGLLKYAHKRGYL